MYLVDTNVISEARKGPRTNPGAMAFFAHAHERHAALFLSVVTLGELYRGVGQIRHRGDDRQARSLSRWLDEVQNRFADYILDIDADIARIWGVLRGNSPHHALDKLIAATALIHDLTVVTRNHKDFDVPQLRVINPFTTGRIHEPAPRMT